jgi:mannose-6-phosphate isomerase-like protein (cupin superfamily)
MVWGCLNCSGKYRLAIPCRNRAPNWIRALPEDDGASRFEDVELEGTLTHIVDGVHPLLVSGSFACSEITFVDQREYASNWETHVAPRRQWLIVISGRAVVTTSDGERREVGPGDVVLAEDTAGRGHLTMPLTEVFRFAMIPVAT